MNRISFLLKFNQQEKISVFFYTESMEYLA